MIGDPKRYNAMLLIEQTSMKFIDTAMRSGEEVSGEKRMPEVSIKFDQMPHDTFTGRVVKVSIDPETVAPQRLSTQAGGDAPTVIDPKTNTQKLQTVSYNAHVPLDDPNGLLRIGLKGRAKVHVAWEPLCKRMWRFVMHTFNFKM